MPHLRTEVPQDHRVSITYGDGSHSFRLAPGTTFGELATRVGGLDGLHHRSAVLIEIVLDLRDRHDTTTLRDIVISH